MRTCKGNAENKSRETMVF